MGKENSVTEIEHRENGEIGPKYFVTTKQIKNGPGFWDFQEVTVWEMGKDGRPNREVGKYERNYGSLYHTFLPFTLGDKEYALYSPKYTATRLLELPSCQDLGGEEDGAFGFCPVDYFVPDDLSLHFGFVAGCVWGDDSSWKIEFLDLTRIDEGIIKRDSRFGYNELPDGWDLKDAIGIEKINGQIILKISVTDSEYDSEDGIQETKLLEFTIDSAGNILDHKEAN